MPAQIKTKVVTNAWMHDLYCKIPLCLNALWLAIIIDVTGNAVCVWLSVPSLIPPWVDQPLFLVLRSEVNSGSSKAQSQRSLSSCLEWALKHVARPVYTTSLKKTNLESLDDLGKDYDDCSQKLHDLCHWIYASNYFTLFPPDYIGHVQHILWHPNKPCHRLTHWHTSHSEGMQCPLRSKLSQHAFLCVL